MTNLEAALTYCELGWSVIPLRCVGDVAERKRPAVSSWQEFQEVAAEEDQIRDWWGQNPDFNIGILTGSVSSLLVFDFDGPNAVALLKAQGVHVPPTAAVSTGKGFHGYFEYSDSDIGNKAAVVKDGRGSAVDIRGEGGYVVAPPSVHGSGRVYQWVRGPKHLKALPLELQVFLSTPQHSHESTEDWYKEVAGGVGKGERNETAARVAAYWLRVTSGSERATLRALELWNVQCKPPLPDGELVAVVASMAKRHHANEVAEASKTVPRIEVLDGPEWAQELATNDPRRGTAVDTPGMSAVDGLVPGDLIVIAGRPGAGKSTYATQLSVDAGIWKRVPTFIISTEMNRLQWGAWMAAVILDKPYNSIGRPLPERAIEQIAGAPIGISDTGSISISDIRTLAEGRLGMKLLIVDHIGRVTGSRKDTRSLEIGEVVRGLKSLAKDLKCTVLALCQLNRAVEGRESGRPRLSDLRESGEIEQEADAVFFLFPTKMQEPTGADGEARRRMIMALEKFRFGPTADLPTSFNLGRRRFDEARL